MRLLPDKIFLLYLMVLPWISHATQNLKGQKVDPLSDSKSVTVLVFVSIECPLANQYAPEIQRLEKKFSPKGIKFYLVYTYVKETPGQIRRHMEEYHYSIPALFDDDHALVKQSGATMTPEVAVFSSAKKLVYRGRIDDRYTDIAHFRATPVKRDLHEVLTRIVGKKEVSFHSTQAVGCYIPDLSNH